MTRPRAAILLYHRVGSPATDVYGMSIPAREFRAGMAHLREHYQPMALDELALRAASASLPDRTVAVTFDDGYLDNFVEASPILSEFRVPATFFIPTGGVNDDHEFWWDTLERLFVAPQTSLPRELRIDLPEGARSFSTGTTAERLSTHAALYPVLVVLPPVERGPIITSLVEWSGWRSSPARPQQRMRPREIVELASRAGHQVGAHTIEHSMLPRQSREIQRAEIDGNRRALEALLDRPVGTFAYPFGAFSDETVEIVREASFGVAVTCESRCLESGADLLRLPRLEVTPSNSADFANWLARGFASDAPTFVP
jgi:peptidoglycan/xylan/chitin deacetylase (PgdA/CDA1 family)